MLTDGRRVISIAPAYNEEARVAKALIGMPAVVDCPLVVDDGSTDGTAEVARAHGATVLTIPQHTNLDNALRTGFAYALEHNYDVIIVMAGNGKDTPTQIPRLLAPLEEDRADYVQGSRYMPGGNAGDMPTHRAFATRLYPRLLRIFPGFPATDGTNGFRAYKASILKDARIDIYQPWLCRTGVEFYLSIKVMQLGYRVVEVPVSKIYPQTTHYKTYTKVKPFSDWWNILKPWVYLSCRIKK
jgi:glycosyltransferase involved in cell wall biosynthesis